MKFLVGVKQNKQDEKNGRGFPFFLLFRFKDEKNGFVFLLQNYFILCPSSSLPLLFSSFSSLSHPTLSSLFNSLQQLWLVPRYDYLLSSTIYYSVTDLTCLPTTTTTTINSKPPESLPEERLPANNSPPRLLASRHPLLVVSRSPVRSLPLFTSSSVNSSAPHATTQQQIVTALEQSPSVRSGGIKSQPSCSSVNSRQSCFC